MESSVKLKSASLPYLEEFFALPLAFLFFYTGILKLYDWKSSVLSMHNQVIPEWSILPLIYGLPLLEIILAILLLFPAFRVYGYLGSTVLLSLFTGYVAYVWLGFADRVPCSCGGIISSLSWGQHLIFNLFFLLLCLAGWGIRHQSKKIQGLQGQVGLFKKEERIQSGQ